MAINKFSEFLFVFKNACFRSDVLRSYKQAKKNQNLSYEELESRCWNMQVELVNYAYKHIPFYKDYYDSCGFSPATLKTKEDWGRIPIVEKNNIRENFDKFVNPDIPSKYLSYTTTGGSTGLPLKVGRDKRFHLEIVAWRFFMWWGISYSDNTAITHRRVPQNWKEKIINQVLWWPTRRIYLSATSMTDEEIAPFVQALNSKKIVWLTGYAGALERIADYILKHNIFIMYLKMVWSTSAPLSEIARRKMEKAYGCKVMNQYGSCEVSHIATQCPYSEHMHINSDFVHVDVVDAGNNCVIEEEGDILVTDLHNYAFPLIKYRLGDRGCLLKEKCSCGLPFPMMKSVKGRISDAIYTPSGIYVDGNYLTTIFDNYCDIIDQFQVYQKKDYCITIKIKVRGDAPSTVKDAICSIKKKIESDVHNEVMVTVEQVDSIPHDRGKIRYIVSEVALGME